MRRRLLASIRNVESVSYLLDDYSSSQLAYSLRKLSSTYVGNCIKVRRSSDNTELDIGFVLGVLDISSLLAFCGAGSGYVVIVYDQSGNNNNAYQPTATAQARIVLNGVLEVLTGTLLPTMTTYNSSVAYFLTDLIPLSATFTNVNVYRKITADETVGLSGSTQPYPFLHYVDGTIRVNTIGGAQVFGTKTFPNNYIGISYKKESNLGGVFMNNSQLGSEGSLGVCSGSLQYFLTRVGGGANFMFSETILFNVDHSSVINNLSNDLNSYYGIY